MSQSNDHTSIEQAPLDRDALRALSYDQLQELVDTAEDPETLLAALEEADRRLEETTEALIDRAKERGVSERQARADMRRVYTVLRSRSLGRPLRRYWREYRQHVGGQTARQRRTRRTLRARAAAQQGDGGSSDPDPDAHVNVLPPLQYLPALPCALDPRSISPLGEVSPAQWVFSYPHKQKKGLVVSATTKPNIPTYRLPARKARTWLIY